MTRTVLIIESDADVAKLLARQFHSQGWVVLHAQHGESAVRINCDAIVTSWSANGERAVEIARDQKIPVVVYSGSAEAYEWCCANDVSFAMKPESPILIEQLLSDALKDKRANEESKREYIEAYAGYDPDEVEDRNG